MYVILLPLFSLRWPGCDVHSQHVILYEAVFIVERKISILYDSENKFLVIWLDDDNDTNFEHDYHVELDFFVRSH